MPEQSIPFGNREGSGLPEEAGASPVSVNVLADQLGAVHRRPGLRTRAGLVSTAFALAPISGIWVTNAGDVYAVDEAGALRNIYRVTASAANLSLTGPEKLLGNARPAFAETEALLAIAGGDQMQKVVFATGTSSRLEDTASPSDPPKASHVVANQSRLLANDSDNPNFLRFSDLAAGTSYTGHEYWLMAGIGTSGFVAADARPDPIMAVWDNLNEVFVFQPRTLQVYAPDALAVYALASTRQIGCSAAHSVIPLEQAFAWLDEQRRFIQSDGRSVQVLSQPIAQTLRNLTTVSDCFGYRFNEGFADVLVWTFPTDGITFAYQQGVGWSRWAGWTGNWTTFPVTSHQVNTDGNLVGLNDGRIGELSSQVSTDYGEPIRAFTETGFINHGTDLGKLCKCVRISLRRGRTVSTSAPQARLVWRDRPDVEAGSIPISLGAGGDTEVVIPFYSLGVYRSRQWSFEFTGTEELVLVSAKEEYEVLRS